MLKIPAVVLFGGLVAFLAGCDSRECLWDNDCGTGAMCAADGQCLPADGLDGAPPVAGGVYAEGVAVSQAALRGDIGSERGMSGPAHRVEVYEWDLGTDILVYSPDGDAFSFIYMDQPLDSLPEGTTTFQAGRPNNGVEVNGQLCITGGGYDVPAQEIAVTVRENSTGEREYSFDARSAGEDWAVTDLVVQPSTL